MDLLIRHATPQDTGTVFHLVQQLAIYEKLEREMVASEADFRNALFGERRLAEALLAFADEVPVGLALYFRTFPTFIGRAGLHLEDLFVEPAHRSKGIGKALLRRLGQIAKQENLGRIEWTVLTWNQPSIDFYHHLGAVTMEDWRVCRLSGDALNELAE